MCGRYVLSTAADEDEAARIMAVAAERAASLGIAMPDGDVAPSDIAPVFVAGNHGGMNISFCRWGFVTTGSRRIINARRESIMQRPAFRSLFSSGRCVVPSTGYYEWSREGHRYLFNTSDTCMVYMAGLFRRRDNDLGDFTVITGDAGENEAAVHHRMPLIISRENLRGWLCSEKEALELCRAPIPRAEYRPA